MNTSNIDTLPHEALHHLLARIQKEQTGLRRWREFGISEQGKWLKEELESDLSNTQSYYRLLPVADPALPFWFTANVGSEETVLRFLNKLSSSEKYEKELDEQVKYILELLKSDRKPERKREGILPDHLQDGI